MRRDFPWLWYEQQIYSQNREDGIIALLCDHLAHANKLAIEIGSSDGTQNMIRNLIVNHEYFGLGHDGLDQVWTHDRYQHVNGWVSLDNIDQTVSSWPDLQPDFFSLDIDSFDFWILKHLMYQIGLRPSVICVEYLGYYGPYDICSVRADLGRYRNWKCGASLSAFKQLLARFHYEFFTCDTMGVNAFFYLPSRMQNVADLKAMPRHAWRCFPKYQDHVIDPLDPEVEFNWNRLLDNV